MNELVASRLKQERERQRLSQLELSLKAGISQGFLAMIESNRKIPTLTTVFKLSRALNIRPSFLFEQGEPNREQAKAEIIALIQKNL